MVVCLNVPSTAPPLCMRLTQQHGTSSVGCRFSETVQEHCCYHLVVWGILRRNNVASFESVIRTKQGSSSEESRVFIAVGVGFFFCSSQCVFCLCNYVRVSICAARVC